MPIMKRLSIVCILLICISATPLFAQDPFAPLREGLRDLQEGVVQGRQMRYEAEDRARAAEQRHMEAAVENMFYPVISANGINCLREQEDYVMCYGVFDRLKPQVMIGATSRQAVLLFSIGRDSKTGNAAQFAYNSTTGCVQIMNIDPEKSKILDRVVLDREGNEHAVKKNRKVKGCQ